MAHGNNNTIACCHRVRALFFNGRWWDICNIHEVIINPTTNEWFLQQRMFGWPS